MSSTSAQQSLLSKPQLKLAFASIGVVFGDIGTSPIYTMREALKPVTGAGVDVASATYGVVSLLIWALILIVTLKYVIIIMRADNHGEGGILSEVVLVENLVGKKSGYILALGMIGAAFFFGDAMITPAISVLSAVEGLQVINADLFTPFILPLTLAILVGLFLIQFKGTDLVAKYFAPITFIWFLVLAALGLWHLSDNLSVFQALNPLYGINMLWRQPGLALLVTGGVFLAVTGGEALYADMGHLGKNPIRLAWLAVVFPGLALNYLGQGAFVMAHPEAVSNPFFLMTPSWALVPLVLLTTVVTVIASQAVITGAFSIGQQAIALGLIPRMNVTHTSETESGQIYVSQINWMVMFGVIMLVLVFRSSDGLASAYGIAVNVAMLVNTLLGIIYFWKAEHNKRWILVSALIFISLLEFTFLAANGLKIANGGYLPILIGLAIIMTMLIWRKGIRLLLAKLQRETLELKGVLESLERHPPARVAGAAVFMQTDNKFAPSALMHNLKHNRVLHDRLIFIAVKTMPQPRWEDDRVVVTQGPLGSWIVEARFGYMEQPDVRAALRACAAHGLEVDPRQASYFLGRRVIKTSAHAKMPLWQQRIFIMLANQSARAIDFFRIPPDRVVELGMQMSV
ncbi:potassium transporter Kup [Aestuariivirga litoralis]|uniref:potassium transporter Kup n=1 Tax=Aestuariivirga litoralis TaxID=2650924 RepID=UPI0018C7D78D|nr:potassium transporter Kup [Aestuariivirga litoralis]MBG1231176.1 potassium transporter Kup [Aestuariivirga litoralis]